MKCKVLKATSILLEIRRSLVKADWCSVIIVVKIFLSLLVKTLENILYKTLQRLIGRHSWTCFGFKTLEMRVTKVWLTGWGKYLYLAKTKLIGQHHDQLYSKSADKGGIPSSLGALMGAICWSA